MTQKAEQPLCLGWERIWGMAVVTDDAQKRGCYQQQDRSGRAKARLVHHTRTPIVESRCDCWTSQSSAQRGRVDLQTLMMPYCSHNSAGRFAVAIWTDGIRHAPIGLGVGQQQRSLLQDACLRSADQLECP